MINYQKGFAHLFLLFIIVLITVGGIGYFAYKNGQVKIVPPRKESIPFPSLTPDPSINWQIYTNPQGEYLFKYPVGLKTDTDAAGVGAESIRITYINPNQNRKEGMLSDGYMFIVTKLSSIDQSTAKKEAETTYEGAKSQCPSDSVFSTITPTKIDNRDGFVFTVKGCLSDYSESYIAGDTYIYRITQIYPGTHEDQISYKNILDQILSTFKFTTSEISRPCDRNLFPIYKESKFSNCVPIERQLTANWKKYEIFYPDQISGFFFNYPENLIVKNLSSNSPTPENFSLQLDQEKGVEENSPIITLNTMRFKGNFSDWLRETYDKYCPGSFESCTPLIIVGSTTSIYQYESINRNFASIDSYDELWNGLVIHFGMNARKEKEPFSQEELKLYNQIIERSGFFGP